MTTRGQFDRESQARYVLPIYVRDANRVSMSPASAVRKQRSSESNAELINAQHFDVATLIVSIGDVNDNAPEFRPGACYGLSVPENSDTAIIHTVVASDADEGPNAELVYSIVGMLRPNPLSNHSIPLHIFNSFFYVTPFYIILFSFIYLFLTSSKPLIPFHIYSTLTPSLFRWQCG